MTNRPMSRIQAESGFLAAEKQKMADGVRAKDKALQEQIANV